MAKASKDKAPATGERMVTCILTGITFPYSGRGRPPKYHASVKGEVLKTQRKASRDRKAASKASTVQAAA